MVRAELLLLIATTISCLGSAWTTCKGSQKIECPSKGQCIKLQHVCNGGRDCTDNSDEVPELCAMWTFEQGNCSDSRISCKGRCYSYPRFCTKAECAAQVDPRVCQMVVRKKLAAFESTVVPLEELEIGDEMEKRENFSITEAEPVVFPMGNAASLIKDEEEVPTNAKTELLTVEEEKPKENEEESMEEESDEKSMEEESEECPSLYFRVGSRCIALFSLAKVPWPEAREFCRSIHGELADFPDATSFADLLRYLRERGLTTDFWTGGRYRSSSSSWEWVGDSSPMPQGSPFWAERYSSSCVYRTTPFSTAGELCFHYQQAPRKIEQGWCAVLTYEHHFYMSDEACQSERSPLCVLVDTPPDSVYLRDMADL